MRMEVLNERSQIREQLMVKIMAELDDITVEEKNMMHGLKWKI